MTLPKPLRLALLLILSLAFTSASTQAQTGPEAAQHGAVAAPVLDPGPPPPGPFGIAAHRPVLGAACAGCPWGALADKVKEAMAPDYDVQICHNCSGADALRIVDERRKGPRPLPRQVALGARTPPDAPVDFGVVEGEFLYFARHGLERYAADQPHQDLQLIARIECPTYYLVAVRKGGAITDLADIAKKHLPAIIVVDDKGLATTILDYYGINEKDLNAWGGKILRGPDPDRENYSVIIGFAAGLNNTPESGIWYQLSQTSSMQFLQLPQDLLARMTGPVWSIHDTPVNMIRGMDKPIRTVVSSGVAIYGRADLPQQFTYDVARALDRNRGVLKWSLLAFSYEPDRVWNFADLPLAPGAARYYREKGYMPR
jgi:uncharacterized protein